MGDPDEATGIVSFSGLPPGRLLADRFKVLRLLAAGGDGDIYEAFDVKRDCRVALKTLKPELRGDAAAGERLLREFSLARKFRHPGICRVDEYFPADAATAAPPFFSMELLAGETLAGRLSAGPWSADAALPVWRQLAAALGEVHGTGIVHGDFHPDNVFLIPGAEAVRAVIADFGGAKIGKDKAAAAVPRGVAGYLSPEQIAGGAATPASDVFVLGLLMYEMVAGRPPFAGDPDDPTAPVVHCAAPLRQALPDLNPALDEIVLRCLSPAPENRFADGRAVASALNEICEAQGPFPGAAEAAVTPQDLARAEALLSRGRALLRRHEAGQARELLTEAAAIDAENPRIHCAHAEALMLLGLSDKARAAAALALALAGTGGLDEESRLWITAIHHEAHQHWDPAIESFSQVLRLAPDSADCGLHLAGVFNQAGKRHLGMAVLASLRRMPGVDAQDPRLDLADAHAARFSGDFRGSHALALLAVRHAQARDCTLLAADGESAAGQALYNLGQFKEAAAAYQRARGAYRQAGDRRGLSRVLLRLAEVSWSQGDIDAALALPFESLKICRAAGDRAGASGALNFLAIVLDHQGKLAEAGARFAEVLELARQNDLPHGCATALNNLGENFRRRGALGAAAEHYAEAQGIYRRIGERQGIGRTLDGLGHIALAQGRLTEAHALFTEKEQLARDSDDLSSRAYALYGLGEVDCESDEPVLALRAHEEALALREKLGEKGNAAESALAIAQLHLRAGRLAEAARLSDAAIDEFNAEGRRLDEARAGALRAQVHLAAAEIAPARALLARAQAAATGCQDLEVAIRVALSRAHLELADGNPKPALQLANDSAQRAAACGHERFLLQARRFSAEIESHGASQAAEQAD